ncbi:MAG: glycogen debranching enzyme family protein [Anaerolineae bacterium]|nr:glycogen debranching enzyme family protein [Anaerolineae bacterium]
MFNDPADIHYGREVCGFLPASERREWLVTNGLGGYAAGTVSGMPTRRYHGLLIAALQPPVGRSLLVTKFNETALYYDRSHELFAERRGTSGLEAHGYRYIESFRLEGSIPVWTFAIGDALLEKRVWMARDANTTYVRYDLIRASAPLLLQTGVIVNFRDHHDSTYTGSTSFEVKDTFEQAGQTEYSRHLTITPKDGSPFYLLSDAAIAYREPEWRRGYVLSVESERGLDYLDDNLWAGFFNVSLEAGEGVTFAATTETASSVKGDAALLQRQAYDRQLIEIAAQAYSPDPVFSRLALSADQFIVSRKLPDGSSGHSIIAGYPWFSDWGRDTMISLPGLTLTTGRYEIAASILRTYARFVDQGMLPNRFPDAGEHPEYNTADATLWYFEAIRAYTEATGSLELARELLPILKDIIDWHERGTRYHIKVDPADGLLFAGQDDVQLTWMDVKIRDQVITPRTGKAIEINALWFNALIITADLCELLGEDATHYAALAEKVRGTFRKFWNTDDGCCFDVIEGPKGNDSTVRPNQIFAVSLPNSPLTPAQQQAVVETCARYLLTSYGLRSLSPDDPEYSGIFIGGQWGRDAVYHNGTVWGWLIGPYVAAHLRVYGDKAAARALLRPLIRQLCEHTVGSLNEVFDGDPPHEARGCFAQAWTVAEVLRAWAFTAPDAGIATS